MEETTQAAQPEHERLVNEFMELDKQCQEIVEKFTSGRIIYDCIPSDGAKNYEELFSKMTAKYQGAQEYAKQLIEKRNAKLQEAGAAMRALVMAGENMVRGPDGKASFQKYGPFEVSSKTSRSFDAKVLFDQVAKLGLYDRLRELSYVNKESGQSELAVVERVDVKYEAVKNWLREQNLEPVLAAAYEEEEGTPAVSGPKPIGWIGDVDKKKGGKK